MIDIFVGVFCEQVQGISIPIAIIISVWGGIIAGILMHLKARFSNEKVKLSQLIWRILLVISCCFIYQITIYNRYSGSRDGIVVNPFGQLFEDGGEINLKAACYMFYNVALFIPFGIAFSGIKAQYRIGLRLFMGLVYGFIFSLVIECTQLLLERGYFETEDILTNSIGTVIGCVVYSLLHGVVTWYRQRQ